jgi:predicted small secreted protein
MIARRRPDCENGATLTDPPGSVERARNLRRYVALVAVLGALLLLSSCAAGPNTAAGTGEDPAGFWLGLWHGIIFLVTFVISLFTDNVSVYEIANNGNWYDFGFFLGAAIALGGAGGGASTRGRKGG